MMLASVCPGYISNQFPLPATFNPFTRYQSLFLVFLAARSIIYRKNNL